MAAGLLCACAGLPPGAERPKLASKALPPQPDLHLAQPFAAGARDHPGRSAFRILSVGIDGFLLRAQLINSAERSLDLQYYIFRADKTGDLLAELLLKAADRGVRVRLLVDDGDTEEGEERLALLAAHPGIEVRIFNPFAYRGHLSVVRGTEFAFNAARLDFRMHNKLLVADNSMALVGGRNLGDQYFQIDPESQFGDDDVMAGGPVVRQLSDTFDDYWNSDLAIPSGALYDSRPTAADMLSYRRQLAERRQALLAAGIEFAVRIDRGEPLAGILAGSSPLVWAPATVVCDSPDKKRVGSGQMIGKLMHTAVMERAIAVQQELLMITPFLIPGEAGMKMLDTLHRRGVRVRILTNSLASTPEPLAHAGYTHYRLPMLQTGVELFEVKPMLGNARGSGERASMTRFGHYALHAKLFVFDRSSVFIGSMNFDQRSLALNTEVGLIIDSPELALQTAHRFEAIVALDNSYTLALAAPIAGRAPQVLWRSRSEGLAHESDDEPAHDFWQRFKFKVLSWLPIEGEL
jgi:putative cardiolipin synthase